MQKLQRILVLRYCDNDDDASPIPESSTVIKVFKELKSP
jgi:hypothetical protein